MTVELTNHFSSFIFSWERQWDSLQLNGTKSRDFFVSTESQFIMSYIFEVGPYWEDEHPLQTPYGTLKEAANAAWKFCESKNLEMPGPDWWVDTPYGKQDCYNVIVRSDGDDWEPKEEFLAFVVSTVRRKSDVKMEHDDDMFIRVFKASPIKKISRKVKKIITPKKNKGA